MCTRIMYSGNNGAVVTARTLDWYEDFRSNFYLFPRGMQRDGAAGKNSLTWTSKYSSVIVSAYDIGTAEGMNEKGLVANLLYLADAEFGKRDENRPGLTIAAWTQYVLDNFATVEEAVTALEKEPFQVTNVLFGDTIKASATTHLSISDSTGDSAILEYLDSKLIIHRGHQYQVMTNSPPFDQQIALNTYWESIGGTAMLPGTHRAADRFVRASYYLSKLPETSDPREVVAYAFSIIRNTSVPFGNLDPERYNIAPTRWRTAADQQHLVYYYESTLSPNIVWVSFDKLNHKEGAAVQKLTVVNNYDLVGDVSDRFEPAPPFQFLSSEK